MSGSNGMSPVRNLAEKQKCPIHPNKRRMNRAEADRQAADRSSATKLSIVPYLCAGCGSYHLTSKTDGLTLRDGVYTSGDITPEPPARLTLAEPEPEEPVMPGDLETRAKVVRGWLALNPGVEPTGAQIKELTGAATNATVRRIMLACGYRMEGHARTARWVRDGNAAPAALSAPLSPVAGFSGPVIHPAHPVARGGRVGSWNVVDTGALGAFALVDILDIYAAAGFEVRLMVRTTEHE